MYSKQNDSFNQNNIYFLLTRNLSYEVVLHLWFIAYALVNTRYKCVQKTRRKKSGRKGYRKMNFRAFLPAISTKTIKTSVLVYLCAHMIKSSSADRGENVKSIYRKKFSRKRSKSMFVVSICKETIVIDILWNLLNFGYLVVIMLISF